MIALGADASCINLRATCILKVLDAPCATGSLSCQSCEAISAVQVVNKPPSLPPSCGHSLIRHSGRHARQEERAPNKAHPHSENVTGSHSGRQGQTWQLPQTRGRP